VSSRFGFSVHFNLLSERFNIFVLIAFMVKSGTVKETEQRDARIDGEVWEGNGGLFIKISRGCPLNDRTAPIRR
jgi:hypothetical protein